MEITQWEESEEIIICTNRYAVLPMLIIGILGGIFFFLLAILASISLIVSPGQRNEGTIDAILVFLGFTILSLWLIRSLIDLARPGTPMLVINHTGIRVGTKTYGSTELVFSWEEIQAISICGNTFSIRPTNKRRLFSDFHPVKRFLLHITFPKDISVSQLSLEQPVSVIFGRLQEQFAEELDIYRIQLYP